MSTLESYGAKAIGAIAPRLNLDFGLDIPSEHPDPQDRFWLMPNHPNWVLTIRCGEPQHPNIVTGYSLSGIAALAACQLLGCTGDLGETYTWGMSTDLFQQNPPPMTNALQQIFYTLPGYTQLSVGDMRFLSRRLG